MPAETHEHDLDVQYRDLDPRSHVNHAHLVSSVLPDDDGQPTELPTAWRERFEPYEP